jgi:membrane associated rhomboid family serine protease
MLLPIGDDALTRRTPVVNFGIIAVNVIVFALVNVFPKDAATMRVITEHGLVPGDLKPHTFLTCMFLHGGWMHIIGNMWFLWVFGACLENRLGHFGYAVFYLVAGAGASAFYLLLTPRTLIPCVGASGAIFGVVAAYAVLYPRNKIKMFYWIWWVWFGTFHIGAVWIIGFWFLEQIGLYLLMSELGGMGGVAYAAHLGGGIVGGLIAVGVRSWLPEPPVAEDWESQAHRVPDGWSPNLATASPLTPAIPPSIGPIHEGPEPDTEGLDDVTKALIAGDDESALELYRQHASCRPGISMAPGTQAAVADLLFARAEFEDSLEAYRTYLDAHPAGPDAPTAKYRTAVILSRRMDRLEEAGKLFLQVVMEHPDPEVVAIARAERDRIRALA